MSSLSRRRSAAEACYAALEQRRRRMAATREHLHSGFRAVCAKPGTLLFSFAAGAVLRLPTARGEGPTKPDATPHEGHAPGPFAAALAEFGAFALQASARHLALRAGEAMFSASAKSPHASESVDEET